MTGARIAVMGFTLGVLAGVGSTLLLQHRTPVCHYHETDSARFVFVPGKWGEAVLTEGYASNTLGTDWRTKVFYYNVTSWISKRYNEAMSANVATLLPLAQGEPPRFSLPREDASPAQVLVYSPQDKTARLFEVDMLQEKLKCVSRETMPGRKDMITGTGELVWRTQTE